MKTGKHPCGQNPDLLDPLNKTNTKLQEDETNFKYKL